MLCAALLAAGTLARIGRCASSRTCNLRVPPHTHSYGCNGIPLCGTAFVTVGRDGCLVLAVNPLHPQRSAAIKGGNPSVASFHEPAHDPRPSSQVVNLVEAFLHRDGVSRPVLHAVPELLQPDVVRDELDGGRSAHQRERKRQTGEPDHCDGMQRVRVRTCSYSSLHLLPLTCQTMCYAKELLCLPPFVT